MASVREVITQVSTRLVDQEVGYEFTTWTESQLLDAFNWSLQVAAGRSRADFSRWVTTTLQAGSLHDVKAPCEAVLGVGNLYSPHGESLGALDIIRPMPAALKRKPFCGTSGCHGHEGYRPVGVELSGPRSFRIWPEVPGAGYKLEVFCFSTPQADHLDQHVDVPVRLYAALQELMLYYAHMYDIEAVPSRDRANRHWDAAMAILEAPRED